MGDKEDGHGFEGALDKDMLVTDPDEAAFSKVAGRMSFALDVRSESVAALDLAKAELHTAVARIELVAGQRHVPRDPLPFRNDSPAHPFAERQLEIPRYRIDQEERGAVALQQGAALLYDPLLRSGRVKLRTDVLERHHQLLNESRIAPAVASRAAPRPAHRATPPPAPTPQT